MLRIESDKNDKNRLIIGGIVAFPAQWDPKLGIHVT